MRILLIEDEHRLSDVLKKGFVEDGYAVDQAFDGEEGLMMAQDEPYDAVVLDWSLPKMEGVEVCRRLRDQGKNVPVIMLTAKNELEDKLSGLNAGADDYLTKPFAFAELKARVLALLRRSTQQVKPQLQVADLVLDPVTHEVMREGKALKLTPKEFAMLEYLLRHKGEVISRTQITEHVWDYNFDSMSNVVDVFVATLRKKVDGPFAKKLLHTVHGVGYKIEE